MSSIDETLVEQRRLDEQERKAAMSESYYRDIGDFHLKFKLEYEGGPRELENELALFRLGFMVEELAEYAIHSGFTNIARQLNELHEHIIGGNRFLTRRNEEGHNLEMQFDSIIDLVYVALGTSYLHGFDFDEGWSRVHEANMKKVRTTRPEDSKRGSGFDVVKPRNWAPADLSDLVAPDEGKGHG